MPTERIADLQKKLETARSSLRDTLTRAESERSRRQQELQESQQFFEGLCAKAKKEIEEIEKDLKAEVAKNRDNWKQWPQAVLIRRWETGDFDYKHFKDTDNAKLLRQAYKTCAPDAEPRSVSRIMRVSAQVGAGWYKTPLEAPHSNPPREKSDAASPEATPVKATPAKKTPAKTTPAKATPTKSTPAKTTPAKKTPAEKIPAKTTPVKKTPAQKTPGEKAPAKKTPAEKTPAEPSKIATPTPTCGTKRAHESVEVAGETVEEDSKQQAANKKVKISMLQ